jgi:hypothetical protein
VKREAEEDWGGKRNGKRTPVRRPGVLKSGGIGVGEDKVSPAVERGRRLRVAGDKEIILVTIARHSRSGSLSGRKVGLC